jgi:hypothetical protein
MERGTIKSFSKHSGTGCIADGEGRVINFQSSGILGSSRSRLKISDHVWFDRIGANVSLKAINIRLC